MTLKDRVYNLIRCWRIMGKYVRWQDVADELGTDYKKSSVRRYYWKYWKEYREDKEIYSKIVSNLYDPNRDLSKYPTYYYKSDIGYDMGKRSVEVPVLHFVFVVVSLVVFVWFVFELIKSLIS